MSETEWPWPDVDPDDSPFKAQPIEGMPFEDGSEEDLAIRRILGEDDPQSSTAT